MPPAPVVPVPVVPVPPPGVASAQDTRFYQLTLHGGVEVVRTRDGVLSTIRGETLVAIFSLESKGLDELAFVPAGVPSMNGVPAMTFSSLAMPPALAIGALAFAAPQSVDPPGANASADSVTVSFGGRLEMVPVTDPALRLASADDIRFDVVGPRVELVDGRSKSQITCASLRYSVRDERVEARGRAGLPLRVNNPRMMLEGVAFWASFSEGVGRLEGPGRMAFARASERDVAWLELVPGLAPDAARMLVSADPAAVALLAGQAAAPRTGEPPMPRFDPTKQDLEITWNGGVDLRFAGDGDNAKLSGARFEGGVDVFGRQFELESTSLEVAFAKNDSERIDAIIADGGTKVRQLGAAGAMSAERLELYLAANRQGDTIPSRLVARRAVEAKDAKQTIWTEDLVVTFSEKKAAAGAAAGANAPVPAGLVGEPKLGDIDVEVVEAKGGVQVMLGEGARVFADELTGNARERKLRLTGEDVAIVRSNIIADNLRDLRFDDATRTARSEGPGRFRAFRAPIAVGEGRIERPKPELQASLDASWTGSLDYQEAVAVAAAPAADATADAAAKSADRNAANNKGVLDIRGDVKLRSRPNERTTDAVDANSVVLDLAVAGDEARKDDARKADADGSAAANAARALTHFLARGQARLESRSWADDAHTGEPKLFRITGDHIEYDMLTREGLVVGDGGLLVNLPADATNEPAPAAKGVTSIALGAEGTTRFSWKQRMALERIKGDRYAVRMDDGVEVLHAGVREQDRMSMRCDALEAKVRRADETSADDASGVDLGGPAELLGVKGSGNVFIRTPQQDLECGEFDYSVESGIATLRAAPGRAVTVVFADRPTPLQAQEIDWDLRQGRLEIRKPLVTGGR